jgi:hypothetical protein
MSLARTLTGWANDRLKPIAVSEAEIREELEFHLEMRTLDNQAAGMSLDAAQQDARHRFGDFEQQYQACRSITLGLRLMFRWLQTVLVVALVGTVFFLGVALVRTQARYESQLRLLQNRIHLAQPPSTVRLSGAENRIPFVQWQMPAAIDSLGTELRGSEQARNNVNSVNDFVPHALQRPWSDWQRLADKTKPY